MSVPMSPDENPLPYTDTKPVGAADFYLAIHATFRFIHNREGLAGLRKYWTALGRGYFAPVSAKWSARGLAAISAYWRAFFAAEPGADVEVLETVDRVTVRVKICPAIQHLRDMHREILPCFCQHCYFINEEISKPAGFTARVSGGNGSCVQTFYRRDALVPSQDLREILEAAPC